MTMPRTTITLDISCTAIRLLAARGRRAETWASAPVQPGMIEQGLILDPEALGDRIKRLMQAGNMSGRKVVASVTGLYSICRLVRLPQLLAEESKGEGPVMQAAMAAMPVPLEELYVSWQTIDDDEVGPLAFVIGTPRNIVDAQMQALRSAGIGARILNLKAMALIRLLNPQNALIVNMEPDSLDIALILDGLPLVMRTVVQQPDISLEERIESLATNLEQTTLFHDYRSPASPVSPDLPLFLAGQVADDPAVPVMVQDTVPYPLAPLEIPMEYPRNLPVYQYAVNIGLALAEVSVPGKMKAEEQIPEETETDE